MQHNHIVRAIAFPPGQGQLLATGGMEKKLRIFDLSRVAPISPPTSTPDANKPKAGQMNGQNGSTDQAVINSDKGFEIGAGVHQGTIKAVVWTQDPNILVTAADDKAIRWWDLREMSVVQEQTFTGEIGSCEFTNVKPLPNDIGGGYPVLTIAAGKSVYFYGGPDARMLIKKVDLPYDVASVALHPSQRKFVTGGKTDTWAKVYDYDSEQVLGMSNLQVK